MTRFGCGPSGAATGSAMTGVACTSRRMMSIASDPATMRANVNGPGAADTARALDTGGSAPMPKQVSHGATTRRPVYSGDRRVRGLHERTLADGSPVFEARLRVNGKDSWIVLDAKTKTDAIHELESLRVDRQRG